MTVLMLTIHPSLEKTRSSALTAAQLGHLKRLAAGGRFTDSIPEWRLVHRGFITVERHSHTKTFGRLTEQGRAWLRANG